MKYLYFYIDPAGNVNNNNDLMPVDILRKKAGLEGIYFRFAYEPEANRIYVQDHSFRKALTEGNEDAWSFFNRGLKYLEEKNDARFLAREWGDPSDSGVVRRLSDYQDCWSYLVNAFHTEFNEKPIDIPVYEHVANGMEMSDLAYLMPVGSMIGSHKTTQPMIALNRTHEASKGDLDTSMSSMSLELTKFYLRHAKHLLKACGRGDLAELCSRGLSETIMFAINTGGKTRVFKAKKGNEDEASIRAGLKDAKDMLVFKFDKEGRRICLKNKLPCDIHESEVLTSMLGDIRNNLSKQFSLPSHLITISYEDGLSSGFVSKLSRIKPVWEMIKTTIPEQVGQIQDFPIMMLPFSHPCQVYESEAEEPDQIKNFRATRGLQIQYPFFAVGGISKGRASRQLIDKVLSFFFGSDPEHPDDFLGFLDEHKTELKTDMKFLSAMGYSRSDVLDFFSSDYDLFKRAEYRKIYDETFKPNIKVAQSTGLGLNINDWWKFQLQDAINQADHTNDLNKKDRKKKKKKIDKKELKNLTPSGPRSYELMLRMKHDRDLSAQKSTEQLLRESQI